MQGGSEENESMADKMKSRRRARQRQKADTDGETAATGEETDTVSAMPADGGTLSSTGSKSSVVHGIILH